MDRTFSVGQVLLGVVRLTAHAVETFVRAFVDVAAPLKPFPDLLRAGMVRVFVGGADEPVVGDLHRLGQRLEPHRVPVGDLLRRDPFLLRFLDQLQRVLVGAGQQERLVADQTVPTRQRVGRHVGVRVTDVRLVVDVVNRRGDVEFFHTELLYGYSAWPAPRMVSAGAFCLRDSRMNGSANAWMAVANKYEVAYP